MKKHTPPELPHIPERWIVVLLIGVLLVVILVVLLGSDLGTKFAQTAKELVKIFH